MNKLVRIRAVVASMLVLAIAAPGFSAAEGSATEVELSATSKTPGADANITSYSGEVTLKVPAGTQMHFSAKAMKRERGLEIVRGEVEIKLDKMIVRTQQASIARNEKFTLVKMEAAEVTTVSP